MTNNVTDRILLKAIHDRYYAEFCSFDKNNKSRSAKMYVPIDCREIAKQLDLDPDIVFGRLYYHLDRKYGYAKDDGSKVYLFTMKLGNDKHAVNFPLLSAVVAELEQSFLRFTLPLFLSIAAIAISIVALAAQIFVKGGS